MREHLGDGFPLMVDANMKWTADLAIRAARAFAPLRPHLARGADRSPTTWPATPASCRGRPAGRRRARTCASLWEFKQLIAAGGVTYPEPDVTNCGGVTAFMKIARLAEAFNLPVTSHGAHDVTVQLLAACPNRSYLEAHGFGLDRYIARAARPGGRLRDSPPTGPATASRSTGRGWRRSAHS